MRKQYVDFLDRFDGAGAGQTGNSDQAKRFLNLQLINQGQQ